jgi:polysaccharide chain length determinant protein (PEP-CTERM system associated)
MLPGKTVGSSEILQMAKRRKWLIAVPPVLTLFAALLYSSRVPELYQSEMLIAIVPQRLPDSYVRSTVTLRTEERIDAIAVDVLSRSTLEQLIADMDLYPAARVALPIEDVLAMMRENLEVGIEPVRRGPRGPEAPHAFHIRFTYPDPQVAATVTERIGRLFVERNVEDRGALARATSEFLEEQLTDARKRLEEQERRVEAFRQRYGNELPTQMQMNLQAMQSTQLQVQSLVEAIARDRDRKQMLERLYRETLNEPAPPVAVTPASSSPPQDGQLPVTSSAQQQLDAARASLATLELRYTADHPDIVRTRRLIAELEPKAAAEAAAAAAAAKNAAVTEAPTDGTAPGDPARRESLRQMRAEIESLDRQTAFKETEERRLRAEILEYQRRVEAVPGVESEWVKLSRDYDTLQAAYKELLAKAGNAKVAVELEDEQIGEQFRVVESAGVPVHPLPSNRPLINLGGLMLGLLLGAGLAAFLEFRDASFRSDADVLEVLELPVLASVPQVLSASELTRQRRRRLLLSAVAATGLAVISYVTWSLQLWKNVI